MKASFTTKGWIFVENYQRLCVSVCICVCVCLRVRKPTCLSHLATPFMCVSGVDVPQEWEHIHMLKAALCTYFTPLQLSFMVCRKWSCFHEETKRIKTFTYSCAIYCFSQFVQNSQSLDLQTFSSHPLQWSCRAVVVSGFSWTSSEKTKYGAFLSLFQHRHDESCRVISTLCNKVLSDLDWHVPAEISGIATPVGFKELIFFCHNKLWLLEGNLNKSKCDFKYQRAEPKHKKGSYKGKRKTMDVKTQTERAGKQNLVWSSKAEKLFQIAFLVCSWLT